MQYRQSCQHGDGNADQPVPDYRIIGKPPKAETPENRFKQSGELVGIKDVQHIAVTAQKPACGYNCILFIGIEPGLYFPVQAENSQTQEKQDDNCFYSDE